MGTRGFVGFVVDGEEKIAYNHFDSYPDGLGLAVLQWLRYETKSVTPSLKERAAALRVVDSDSTPTQEDIVRLLPYHDDRVSTGSPTEWYSLLRETQGNPAAMLDAGVIEDASSFPYDSLFCEWGYLVDLDTDTLEVYKGFQKIVHTLGRFASGEGSHGYFPVALVASWPLSDLPDDVEFLRTLEPPESADEYSL